MKKEIIKVLSEQLGDTINLWAINETADRLEALFREQKECGWIPVSERLPEDYGIYGVRVEVGIYPQIAHYTHYKGKVGFHELQEPHYKYSNNQVTHWQPLPTSTPQ